MLNQIPGVTERMCNAIALVYPTPISAYKQLSESGSYASLVGIPVEPARFGGRQSCISENTAKKIFTFITATNPNLKPH